MKSPSDFADYDVESDKIALERALSSYQRRSELSYSRYAWRRDLSYGSHPSERLDIVSPDADSDRVAVFFHGGWWRSGTKEGRAFLAEGVLALGYHFVNVEYPLAPEMRLPEIVASAERALGFVHRHFNGRDAASKKFVVSGNSAGGHLAACVCTSPALERAGVPSTSISGLLAISGLYDLAPLATSPANDWLMLNEASIRDCSPVRMEYPAELMIALAYGGDEPAGFPKQTELFVSALRSQHIDPSVQVEDENDHLQIIGETPKLIRDHFGPAAAKRNDT